MAFWSGKFERNVERDRLVIEALQKLGWRIAIVWECGLRKPYAVSTVDQLEKWLRSADAFFESELVRPR